jgi:hypothetical protein
MSDYHRDPTQPKARKRYRCIWCSGPIPAGEVHRHQTGIYDGSAYSNRYHDECWDVLRADGAFEEFHPGDGDIPKRIELLMAEEASKEAP